jgi:pimeloyl-ACP methyl ester carboxylesterase
MDSSKYWVWRGQQVHYVQEGDQGLPLLLVHGFGASTRHWRKNIPDLAQDHRVMAIDLLGFGSSAKPNWDYKTEIWRDQIRDFCQQVIREPVVIAGNSLGGYVSLSLASDWSEWIRGVILLNSAGSFSQQKRSASLLQQMSGSVLQWGLSQYPVAYLLFQHIRKPENIRKNLEKVYADHSAITPQLIEDIHRPSCDPGAADVFAALMRAGQRGRTVDELLRSLVRPLLLIWGEKDPWMEVRTRSELYRQHYYQLQEHFLAAGHCPHDERPQEVNQIIRSWIQTTIRPSLTEG